MSNDAKRLAYTLPPIDAAFRQLVEDANRDRELLDIGMAMSKGKLTDAEYRRMGFRKVGDFMWTQDFPKDPKEKLTRKAKRRKSGK